MDNHSDELLFHVDIAAYDGRKAVTSMAAMAIFWNRNCCVEFLDEMINYCGKSKSIPALNVMILISSVVL